MGAIFIQKPIFDVVQNGEIWRGKHFFSHLDLIKSHLFNVTLNTKIVKNIISMS